jgi:hypothetical protein
LALIVKEILTTPRRFAKQNDTRGLRKASQITQNSTDFWPRKGAKTVQKKQETYVKRYENVSEKVWKQPQKGTKRHKKTQIAQIFLPLDPASPNGLRRGKPHYYAENVTYASKLIFKLKT